MDRRRFTRTLALGAAGSLVLPAWATRSAAPHLRTVRLPDEVLHVRHGALDVCVGERSSAAWWSTLRRDVFLADGLLRDPARDGHLITLEAGGPRLFLQGDEVELWDGDRLERCRLADAALLDAGAFEVRLLHRSGSLGPAAHARVLALVRGAARVDGRAAQASDGLVLTPGATAGVEVAGQGVLLVVSRSA